MDTLFWRNANPNVRFSKTRKMFFGRFMWRLEYYVVGARIINDRSVSDIGGHVALKNLTAMSWNLERYRNVLTPHLEHFRTVADVWKDRCKTRGEWNTYHFYVENETDAKAIAEAISSQIDCAPIAVTGPIAGTEDKLLSGAVFMDAEKIPHKYKIMLRDGVYNVQTKTSILTQLLAHPDVRVPPAVVNVLKSVHNGLWGAYFYADDTSITTMLALIAPGLVGKIYTIEPL